MKTTEELKKNWENATTYVAKIGKSQLHYRDGSVGKISQCMVNTQINHQEYSGSTNYWKDDNFDAALSEAIRLNFKDLSEQALHLMRNKYIESLVAEHDTLVTRLALIEELKKENNV